jgi:hypothetical protein
MRLGFAALSWLCALMAPAGVFASPKPPLPFQDKLIHNGVSSCYGSACHSRQEATGTVVRQNEVSTWQDVDSVAGAHSRAYKVLLEPRAQAMGQKLGITVQNAPECLSCHADDVAPQFRGTNFQITDGVGCEACHGGSQNWLTRHYAEGANHKDNVANGLQPLSDPSHRAKLCLSCHYGSAAPNQFVTHRIMAAGHPRLAIELDLFTSLQRHHDEDADYAQRKGIAGGIKTWAVGQAMAMKTALDLFAVPRLATDGIWPEIVFYDCFSCHRPIADDPAYRPKSERNPARPIWPGAVKFNDANLIMLNAATRTLAPGLASRLDQEGAAFHGAMAKGRPQAVAAAGRLGATIDQLAGQFARTQFTRAQTVAVLDLLISDAQALRLTDYDAATQTVMAIDTLLSGMIAAGQLDKGVADGMRVDVNAAYAAVADPNAYNRAQFRTSLNRVASALRKVR